MSRRSGHRPLRGRILSWLFLSPLLLLASSLPFELRAPMWQIGPFSITNVELLLALTLAAAAVRLLLSPGGWVLPDRYWLWLLLFAGGLLLSTLLAPQLRMNALKASLRLIVGILLALAVPQIARRPGDSRILGGALVSAGLIAAAIGWWEIGHSELGWASLFRTQLTRAGAFLRLTGTFGYANQAAMYIEATLPFLLAAAWSARQGDLPRRAKYPLLALLFLLILFYAQASILTLSRASIATIMLACLLLALWLAVRQPARRRKMAAWWLCLAVIAAALAAGNALVGSQFRLRLLGGNVDEWYRARIVAPPALEVASGATLELAVAVTNEGPLIWRSEGEQPIRLGARWINEAGQQLSGQIRWPFASPVHPQETVQMIVPLTAPALPGKYELYWDVVQEHVLWFGGQSGLFATSLVTVVPSEMAQRQDPGALEIDTQPAWDYAGAIPNRTTLWGIGLRMVRERPLLGIGMDNYRLTYGEWLGRASYDQTVHTNNLYLEMLVSLGLVGAVPFFLWLGGLLIDLARTLRHPDRSMWQVSIAAGLLAFGIHGLLDFFLLFNATGLLFWLLVGLWIGEKRRYAHRI